MQKLTVDLGLQEFEINGEVLRFNPSDPNVYARFAEAAQRFGEIERRMVEGAAKSADDSVNADGRQTLLAMKNADREIKTILGEVFGAQNDFEKIFGGVNVMAVASNGERVITNFIAAISPVLVEGAKRCAREQAAAVVEEVSSGKPQRTTTREK